MRRSLSMLLFALLAIAALLAWRHWPRPKPADNDPLLAGLPQVASIEGDAKGDGSLVVHLLDRHLMPRDLFERDARAAAAGDVSKQELDSLYAAHVAGVEAAQQQQEAVLRELAARIGVVVPVYVEGLTDARMVNNFRVRATQQFDAGAGQLAEARRTLEGLKKQTGPGAAEIAKQYEALLLERLALGAAVGPCVEELVEIRALEDAEALQKASPRWLGGELFDPEGVRARQDAMGRRLAAATEPLVVVLLSGEHDLREALSRHAPGTRYARVTTDAYRAGPSAGR